MELFFTCPVSRKEYCSKGYNLLAGYRVAETEAGAKRLHGRVTVNDPCPPCGQIQTFDAGEISCLLDRQDNDRSKN